MTPREVARRLVYMATFLVLLGHGGAGSCDDVVKNVAKIPSIKGNGPSCGGGTSFRFASGPATSAWSEP